MKDILDIFITTLLWLMLWGIAAYAVLTVILYYNAV